MRIEHPARPRNVLFLASILALSLGLNGEAQSLNTLVQTDTFNIANPTTGSDNSTFSFADFNSSLGTLNSVELTYSGDFSGAVSASGLDILMVGNIADRFTVTQGGATPIGFSAPITVTGTTSPNFTLTTPLLGGSNTTSVQNSTLFNVDETTSNGANLSSYVGTGNMNFVLNSTTSVNQYSLLGTLASANANTSSADTVTLTYGYTAQAVPEPSTFVLTLGVLMLFAIVGMIRRRQATA